MLLPNPKGKPMTGVFIGDTHDPWCDKEKRDRIAEDVAKRKPDYIVQMGDRYDFYCFSSHPSPDLISARDEINIGRQDAEEFWKIMKKASPKSKLIQLWGNHDSRFIKRINEKLPKYAPMIDRMDYKSFWRFDGVMLQDDERSEVKIDFGGDIGWVWLIHGYSSARAYHTLFHLENTITAHTHRAEITWIPRREKSLFEMNVGYIASQNSPVMRYTPQQYSRSVAGYGVIDEYGPRVITLG